MDHHGHSLGGTPTPVSPSELRRRRLAALDGQQQQQPTPPLPLSTPPTTGHAQQQSQQQYPFNEPGSHQSPPPRIHIVVPSNMDVSKNNNNNMTLAMDDIIDIDADDDDDEDGDLQAALAMSLGQQHSEQQQQNQQQQPTTDDDRKVESIPSPHPQPRVQQHLPPPPPPPLQAHVVSLQDSMNVQEWWKTSQSVNIGTFHDIMWESQVTTESDKRRWVGQEISVRPDPNVMDHETTLDATTTRTTTASATFSSTSRTEETLLTLLGSDHRPWGLQQAHGGPCGVLAAVQAEMLRILLFAGHCHPLEFPQSPHFHETTNQSTTIPPATTALSSPVMQRALAMAISIILARAAYMPCAAGDAKEGGDSNAIPGHAISSSLPSSDNKRSVQFVLPIHPTEAGLTWNDLEPWDKDTVSAHETSNHVSNSLRVFTITPVEDNASVSSPKRQKTDGTQHDAIGVQVPTTTISALDEKIIRLALAVTAFLLHPSISATGAVVGNECPLDSFQRPGGVILLVMSLVFSRGHANVSQDMDYPTMLTSQFGHCGQELINLLLTGQAVSNVFDNTLTPSGELTCRGVQARPAVGYLTQLESLRYCEVGGYYKSPRFPVWVVGSTSHFTVLFGDASCLKESKSDILLEKCRRAFKSVEGGDENGFIATSSLDKVLKLLDLDIGGDHAVQTLAAAMEVSGAGIILWDDFWKATSRLLTGASLENVVHGISDAQSGIIVEGGPPTTVTIQEEDRKQTTAERDATFANQLAGQWGSSSTSPDGNFASSCPPARPTSPMEVDSAVSDEELARRLQAQWDAEVSGATSTAASAGGSPASSSQWKDSSTPLFSDDDNNTQHAVADDDVTTLTIFDDSKLPSGNGSSRAALDRVDEEPSSAKQHNFETFGDSFLLYHYNGLRGGTLTPFRVTRLTPEEAVGASIALNRGNANSASHGASGDLEDIVRTKWPSCVINWLGKTPPYVD